MRSRPPALQPRPPGTAPAARRPGGVTAAEERLISLQRQAGNRAVTGLLTVQRKRTTIPADDRELRQVAGLAKLGVGIQDPKAKIDAQWQGVQALYDDCARKGKRNWDNLVDAIDLARDTPDAYKKQVEKDRARAKEKWKRYYYTELRAGRGNTQVDTVGHTGLLPKAKDRTWAYQNYADPVSGTIGAASNYADKDRARTKSKGGGLQNSEVLWRQYRKQVKTQNPGAGKKGARDAARKNLNRIVRENIANSTTNAVVFMVYPDIKTWSRNLPLAPGSADFLALLGTPNVAPAAFLLTQHADEVGQKSVTTVTPTTDKSIVIDMA